jgi:carboxyl-terminal processing protease
MRQKWLLTALAVLAVSIVAVQAQFSRDFSDEFLGSATGRAFMQTYGALKSNYLDEVEDEALIQGAINGMLEALDDRFSYYTDPAAAARDEEDLKGSFEGIGAVLSPLNRETNQGVEVINVYRDGPAWNAGVLRGDVFMEVDGVNVETFTPSEVAGVVRGPKGTVVNLKMLRPGAEGLLEFSITRGTINIISAESTVLPNNVGYISLSTFANQRLYDQLTEQLNKLKAQGVTSLILDMRDNGGGLLNQGILVADEFLSEGDIVFQRARGVTQRLAQADSAAFDLPMVVLVNKNSASASEIVAGALQENHRALVVGEQTFGKGVAQSVISLSDGGKLAYVSFEWLTPNRNSIHKTGITPDVLAADTRSPDVISVEGQGTPGQTIEFVIGGESVGSTTVDEEGTFKFVSAGPTRNYSEDQGQALVDLETDNALKIAYDTLLNQIATSN